MKFAEVYKFFDNNTKTWRYEVHFGYTGEQQFDTAEDMMKFLSARNITHIEFSVDKMVNSDTLLVAELEMLIPSLEHRLDCCDNQTDFDAVWYELKGRRMSIAQALQSRL